MNFSKTSLNKSSEYQTHNTQTFYKGSLNQLQDQNKNILTEKNKVESKGLLQNIQEQPFQNELKLPSNTLNNKQHPTSISLLKKSLNSSSSSDSLMNQQTNNRSQHSTLKNVPYHYQYNKDDSQYLKDRKYQQRLTDLYSLIAKNQACVLPDPKLQCSDGLPLFNIFTEDFKEMKQFNNFKFNFIFKDTKKNTCQLMGDVIKPQILKIKQKNKDFQQSESIMQLKSKLTQLRIKEKQQLQQDLKDMKDFDLNQDNYLMNFVEEDKNNQQTSKNTLNSQKQDNSLKNEDKLNKISLQPQQAFIKQRTVIRKISDEKSEMLNFPSISLGITDRNYSKSPLTKSLFNQHKINDTSNISFSNIKYDPDQLFESQMFQDKAQLKLQYEQVFNKSHLYLPNTSGGIQNQTMYNSTLGNNQSKSQQLIKKVKQKEVVNIPEIEVQSNSSDFDNNNYKQSLQNSVSKQGILSNSQKNKKDLSAQESKHISDSQSQEVKEKWLASKIKLEKKIIKFNQKNEITKKILNMIHDRKSPEPLYKYQSIQQKYDEQQAKQEIRQRKLQNDRNKVGAKQSIAQQNIAEELSEQLKDVAFYGEKDRIKLQKRLTKIY
eukprot:403343565